jgi:hypothetical protein
MTRLASVIASVGLAACSSAQEATPTEPLTFSAQPLMTVVSGSGKLAIDVRTAPLQPPTRGLQGVELVIRDSKTGASEPGLTLGVLPWMPAMDHGASLAPRVQEGPPGTYVVSDVDFFMPGTWELRTSISGAVTDHAAPSFQIP